MYQTIKEYAKANGLTVQGVHHRIKKQTITPDRIRKNDAGRIEIKVRED